MGVRQAGRAVLMFVGLVAFSAAITLNTLAGLGPQSGIFEQSTEDVTLKYLTPLTPAPWSLFVWDFIYVWFLFMFLYLLAGLCRRGVYEWMYTTPAVLPYGFYATLVLNMSLNITWLLLFHREGVYEWMYTTPAVLPYGFYATLVLNMSLNITWLLLFHREMLLPAVIISAVMSLTDYLLLFFSCQGLKVYGPWLHTHRRADLWAIRVLVQNGVAVYAAWGSVSTLMSLSIYLEHHTPTSRCDCAMISLMVLLMELLAWFLLENLYLDEHVRYVLTIYPVVILWLAGSVTQSVSPGSHVYVFAVVVLVAACVMFAVRVPLVVWRHRRRPLYRDPFMVRSPVEISLTQRRVFL